MNSVERLLAQGEQILALFDEMYRERDSKARDSTLPKVDQAEVDRVAPLAIELTPDGSYWTSTYWLQAAVEASILESRQAGRSRKPTAAALARRAADILTERLAEREELLNPAAWRTLVADVVQESGVWGAIAPKLVSLAEEVSAAARVIYGLRWRTEPMEWWSNRINVATGARFPAARSHLRDALDMLHPYAKPPKVARVRADVVRNAGAKIIRSRKGRGGRPEKFPLKFMREVVAARQRDSSRAQRAKSRLPVLHKWLADYCTKNGINLKERFPSKYKDQNEPWDIRANRFWKAAKKRLRDSSR